MIRGRQLREALGETVRADGHLIYPLSTRRAESACIRRDKQLGRVDDHDKTKEQMSTFTATTALLAPGKYGLELVQVGDIENGQYGARIKLTFRHTTGEFAGEEWVKSFKASMKEGSALRDFVEGLIERELQPGESVDLEDFVGWKMLVKIGKDSANGTVYNKIESFLQIRKPPGAAAKPAPAAQPAPTNSALDALDGDAELADVPF